MLSEHDVPDSMGAGRSDGKGATPGDLGGFSSPFLRASDQSLRSRKE